MTIRKILPVKIFLLILFLQAIVLGQWQGKPYEGPDDPAGDPQAERTAYMNGNRVLLFFRNTTELSDCCDLGYDVSKWPNNYNGTKMHDGIALMVGAKVYLENDSIPVDDKAIIESRDDLDSLVFIQSSYREFMDKNKDGDVEWGFYPVFGYFNESVTNVNETPAMSNDTLSWPIHGWPAAESHGGVRWQGKWNGRFGNVMRADLESYFVANDAQDQENLQSDNKLKYYPRPGVKIGDKATSSVQNGMPWGGLGLRIATRGFQWANPQATDALFWEYNISNISDYDLPKLFFGCLVDNAVGGEEWQGADDIAYYINENGFNMCYSWDMDFIPKGGGYKPGVMGIAYLESPGIPFDGEDNDDDGLVDEMRDNPAGEFVDSLYHFKDQQAIDDYFAYYYGSDITEDERRQILKPHWEGDEDQDWIAGYDANGDGIYGRGESVGDDVGLDGIGPNDPGYDGPDADGTEGNNKPDYIEGVGCEPNFAATDVSESDMLGLTTFQYDIDWVADDDFMELDESMYNRMVQDIFDDAQYDPRNFIELFASGEFSLYKGRTERISLCELHSYENHSVINTKPDHNAPALFNLKKIVQSIYEADYQFAQPPLTPTLTAIPGDGKVTLTWDNVADQNTFDPYLAVNDFEGYKLYRSTSPNMSDAENVTDGYGNLFELSKPIFQCDLDNSYEKFSDYGLLNGTGFYLGVNSGLQHYFEDENVENGRTYYYVLSSYDYGSVEHDITPSQSSYVIRVDQDENVQQVSKNVAVVVPGQRAAGYVSPEIEMSSQDSLIGSGTVVIDVVDKDRIKADHEYRVVFDVDENFYTSNEDNRPEYDRQWRTSGFKVFDITDSTMVYYESDDSNELKFSGDNMKANNEGEYRFKVGEPVVSEVFDGLQLKMILPTELPEIDEKKSGWLVGDAPIQVFPLVTNTGGLPDAYRSYPWDYEIVFTDNDSVYVGDVYVRGFAYNDGEEEATITKSKVDVNHSFGFYIQEMTHFDSTGQRPTLDMIVWDVNEDDVYNDSTDIVIACVTKLDSRGRNYLRAPLFGIRFNSDNFPKPNDVYKLNYIRPFHDKDTINFSINPEELVNDDDLKETMDSIRVVPNPYVAVNTIVPAISNWQLNQKRKIMFTHVPARCTITILTVSGAIVDVIEVNNSLDARENSWDLDNDNQGMAFWDLKNREGLEVASGYYLYHVKSKATGDEKVGKFAILK